MININFYSGLSLYIFICIGAILAIWLFNKKEKDKNLSLDYRFIWFCSVCTYTYINTKEETISTCPRCRSYNKKIVDHTAF